MQQRGPSVSGALHRLSGACLVDHGGAGCGHVWVQPRSHRRQDGAAQRRRVCHLQGDSRGCGGRGGTSVSGWGSCRPTIKAPIHAGTPCNKAQFLAEHAASNDASASLPGRATASCGIAPRPAGQRQRWPCTLVRMKGTPLTSACVCSHRSERVAPPATVTLPGWKPASRIVSKMCSVPAGRRANSGGRRGCLGAQLAAASASSGCTHAVLALASHPHCQAGGGRAAPSPHRSRCSR